MLRIRRRRLTGGPSYRAAREATRRAGRNAVIDPLRVTEHRLCVTELRLRVTKHRFGVTKLRLRVTKPRPRVTKHRSRVTELRLGVTNHRSRVTKMPSPPMIGRRNPFAHRCTSAASAGFIAPGVERRARGANRLKRIGQSADAFEYARHPPISAPGQRPGHEPRRAATPLPRPWQRPTPRPLHHQG
jgi:hypothetical protein